ncbi:MAG: permease DMT superfamily [bacterium]|nr:MAG: permease DMT superfamily [bacterium]
MEKSLTPPAINLESTSDPKTKVYLALLSVQIFFGIHYFAAKEVLKEIPAPTWASLRVTLGAIVMLLLVLPRAKKNFPRSIKDFGLIFIYSVFGVAINQICFTEGLARTIPTHSAIINTVIPITTLLFAILFKKETFSLGKALSILVSLSGVLYLLGIDKFDLSSDYIFGDLLTLTNALSFSLFLVISKEIVMRYDPFVITAILLAFGSTIITGYGASSLLVFEPTKISGYVWAWGVFIVIFPTVLAYFFNYWALKRVESSLVAFFIYIQPPIAATLSIIFRGEQLTLRMIISAILIFIGSLLSVRARRLG